MIDEVISVLGGVSETSRLTGAPTSTVHSWKAKGRVPRWRWPELEAAARMIGPEALSRLHVLMAEYEKSAKRGATA